MMDTGKIWSRKLKIFGVGMCCLGVLAVAGGLIGGTALYFMQVEDCRLAEEPKAETDRLTRGGEASRRTANGQSHREQSRGEQTSAEACKKAQANNTVAAFLVTAVSGAAGVIVVVLGVFIFFLARTSLDG